MFFFFQAEDGIRVLVRSRGLGDVYKRQQLFRKGLDKSAEAQLPRSDGTGSVLAGNIRVSPSGGAEKWDNKL